MQEVPPKWRRLVEFALMGVDEHAIAIAEGMTVSAVRNALLLPEVSAAIEQLKADAALGLKNLADDFDSALRLTIERIKESLPNAPLKDALKAVEVLGERHPSGMFGKQSRKAGGETRAAMSLGMSRVLQRADQLLPKPVEAVPVESHEPHTRTSEARPDEEPREAGDDPVAGGDSLQW